MKLPAFTRDRAILTVALSIIVVEMVLAAFGRLSLPVLTVAMSMLAAPVVIKTDERERPDPPKPGKAADDA